LTPEQTIAEAHRLGIASTPVLLAGTGDADEPAVAAHDRAGFATAEVKSRSVFQDAAEKKKKEHRGQRYSSA
jgi:hypothetical protein